MSGARASRRRGYRRPVLRAEPEEVGSKEWNEPPEVVLLVQRPFGGKSTTEFKPERAEREPDQDDLRETSCSAGRSGLGGYRWSDTLGRQATTMLQRIARENALIL